MYFGPRAVRSQSRCSYRTGVVHGLDEGVVVVRHFFVIGAKEAQRFVVAVGFSVEPGDGLVADVGEVLSRCRTQQLEERHLDAADGTLLYIHVGELSKKQVLERRAEEELRLKHLKARLTILPRLNSLNHVPGDSFGQLDILTCLAEHSESSSHIERKTCLSMTFREKCLTPEDFLSG